jgi:hypothetical protein
MKLGKILIAFSLSFVIGTQTAFSKSIAPKEQLDTYEVTFEDLTLAQRALIFLLGLNWSEIYIKTVCEKSADNKWTVTSVSSWSDYEDEPDKKEKDFNLENSPESFLNFIKLTYFRKDEAARILELFNYLYDESTTEEKFDTTNLFENGSGSMHCKLTKEIQKDKNVVTIQTFNSSGNKNADIEVIVVKNGEKYIEKISARLKIGIKIILTRRNPS